LGNGGKKVFGRREQVPKKKGGSTGKKRRFKKRKKECKLSKRPATKLGKTGRRKAEREAG